MIRWFFAHNGPAVLVLLTGTVAGMFLAICSEPVFFLHSGRILQATIMLATYCGAVVVSGLAGFFVAVLLGSILLPPLYRFQAWRNGAPYQVGDSVRILCGQHSGQTARVYELWLERGQARLELGEEEKQKVNDVYSLTEDCRVTTPTHAAKLKL